MEDQTTPEFLISQMRLLTSPEMSFFYVTNQPTTFAGLEKDLDPLLSSLYAAKAQTNIPEAGPDVTRYYKVDAGPATDGVDLYLMEVGVAVKPGTLPAGEAQVKTLPQKYCAGLLLWGSLAHIGEAYAALMQGIREAGLEHTGECQEWNYRFESVDSPNNLMGLYMEVVRKPAAASS